MLKSSRAGLARAVSTGHSLSPLKREFCGHNNNQTRSKLIRLKRTKQANRQQPQLTDNELQDCVPTEQQQQHKLAASPTGGQQYTCSGCQVPIRSDRYLLKACDKYWHEACLRCARCQVRLADLGASFYCKSDMYLCRRDYLE